MCSFIYLYNIIYTWVLFSVKVHWNKIEVIPLIESHLQVINEQTENKSALNWVCVLRKRWNSVTLHSTHHMPYGMVSLPSWHLLKHLWHLKHEENYWSFHWFPHMLRYVLCSISVSNRLSPDCPEMKAAGVLHISKWHTDIHPKQNTVSLFKRTCLLLFMLTTGQQYIKCHI